jgi:DNA-binding NarL/FixJ family response regulator
MSFWPFKGRHRKKKKNNTYQFNFLGTLLQLRPTNSATQEKRNLEKYASDSPAVSLPYDPNKDPLYQRWLSLSPRDQDIIALICLGYTNDQMAHRLGISAQTIKSYVQTVFNKLALRSKTEIRLTFFGWDFSSWY